MIELSVQIPLHGVDGDFTLDVSTRVDAASLVAISGPSGAGKTSLLRLVAGLSTPSKGRIVVDGETWFDSESRVDLAPWRRSIGYVFQDAALFPHLTVLQNMRYAAPGVADAELRGLLARVKMEDLLDRMPGTLSGGQQQRVQLARALVRKPKLLLLDEPFSALDTAMRVDLQDVLAAVHADLGVTTLLVSHDLGETVKLASRVIVLEKGRIVRDGAPGRVLVDDQVSGKFRLAGEVLSIEKVDTVYVVTVRVGSDLARVVAMDDEVEGLRVGDRVLLSSKAFNPILLRLR